MIQILGARTNASRDLRGRKLALRLLLRGVSLKFCLKCFCTTYLVFAQLILEDNSIDCHVPARHMLKAPRCVHLHGRRPGDFGQILDGFAGWDALLLHGARYPGHLRQEHDVFTPLKLSGVSWPYKKVAVQENDTIPQSILIVWVTAEISFMSWKQFG